MREVLRPSSYIQARAFSGGSGSGRGRPGMAPPATTLGSGGAQKISKAASNTGSSSLRLTKTARSALRKSSWCLRSTCASARAESVRRPGPASRPASCRSRAKVARRGRRSARGRGSATAAAAGGRAGGRALPGRREGGAPPTSTRAGDQLGQRLPGLDQVLLVLERCTQGGVDQLRVEAGGAQGG